MSAIGYLNDDTKKDKNDPFAQLKFVFNENKNSGTPLFKIFQKNFDSSTENYAVVIKNLKNNETFNFNEHKSFQTGSLYKLWVMAASFDQIKQGNLKEDEILSDDVSTLNKEFNISDDLAELTEGKVTLTVKDALFQMITISHNYAAYLLTDKIKLSTIKNYLKNNKFNESNVGEDLPSSTASD
ncbi:MAG: serine hydrolase, partial [bacterium]|nr:serine hydrolase [bacterium]